MKQDFLNYFSVVSGILNSNIIGSFHFWFLKDCITKVFNKFIYPLLQTLVLKADWQYHGSTTFTVEYILFILLLQYFVFNKNFLKSSNLGQDLPSILSLCIKTVIQKQKLIARILLRFNTTDKLALPLRLLMLFQVYKCSKPLVPCLNISK